MQWQPIDTAPRDGNFDVYAKSWLAKSDSFIGRRFTNCYWRDADAMRQRPAGIVGVDDGWRATHYMKIIPPQPNKG